MKVGIIGMGFVGGTAAEVFKKVHEVLPYDKYKPEYQNPEILKEAEIVFICVPTPMLPSGALNTNAIHNSMEVLEKTTDTSNRPLVVLRSTAVSGTTEKLEEKYPSFRFVFNPEFLRQRHALEDMSHPDRIIIGAKREEDFRKVQAVYKPLFPFVPYFHVTTKEAEMIKYASNVVLASQIMIANEIYQICQKMGISYETVKHMLLYDERIARNIDVPGPDGDLGFGGKCFPKDLNALIHISRENGYRPNLLEEVWRTNINLRKNHDWKEIKGATSENDFI
jgi:UDPglucose 6-dehydrogenase